MSEMMLFAGNSNPVLAQKISEHLKIPLGKAMVGTFSDGETMVEIQENVRGRDIFILQSTSRPTNDHLMELIVLVDALRRASARRVTAVVPYFGYARQDRRVRSSRVPITAKVVADMFASVGVGRMLTVDLHADQIQGFFDMPVDNVYATPVMMGDLNETLKGTDKDAITVVSPDIGGVVRARAIAKRLNDNDLAIIDKRRPAPNRAQVMNIIGDVEGRVCLIIDDIVDTAGTLCLAAEALKEKGAARVLAYCTHPVLSGNAVDNINNSVLDELVVTDTIELRDEAKACSKIRELTISGMLSEAMLRMNGGESVSSMFI